RGLATQLARKITSLNGVLIVLQALSASGMLMPSNTARFTDFINESFFLLILRLPHSVMCGNFFFVYSHEDTKTRRYTKKGVIALAGVHARECFSYTPLQ
ncbi:MAG: hypothetical protein KDD10_23050, partial [Phaeodactylibacter sp.]|nr:hypothetical protein [Phaeodactylibacter sp.]